MTASEADDAPEPGPEPSEFVRGLPIGEQLAVPEDSFAGWDTFPFDGELRLKPLTAPVLPEPARHGEGGADECDVCRRPVGEALWADEHWRVDPIAVSGLPAVVMLQPRGHFDLADLPPQRAVELGPMIQRVERAILGLGGIARVHVNRWGDGAAHLHLWFLARPEGMTQLRGTFLSLWDDLLPPLPAARRNAVDRRIAAALAEDGGTDHAAARTAP